MLNIIDDISRDLSYRKHELINLYLCCKESDVLRRCYLVIAAAHFEGFVKTSVNAIWGGIEASAMVHGVLNPIFTTLALEQIFQEYEENKKKSKYSFLNFHNIINEVPAKKCKLKKMESRALSYVGFKSILEIFGLDEAKYELRKNWLDSFLKSRHKISHGENFTPTYDEVREIHEYFVNKLFDTFFYDVEAYIKGEKYLHSVDVK